MEMQNLTVGVLGTGRIGKAVIQNLSGFGRRIIAYDPYPSPALKGKVEYVSLDRLYAESDIITLHIPLTGETEHMIGREAIQKMKPGVVIINCARSALIDTHALIEGIESGRIGSVGVDCFEGEDDVIRVNHNYNSRVTNHDYIILKSFQNTIVTPHVAFFTDQTVFDMVRCSLESQRLLPLFGHRQNLICDPTDSALQDRSHTYPEYESQYLPWSLPWFASTGSFPRCSD